VVSPILMEIVSTIVRCVAPNRVVVFGSQARGDAGPVSDIDLFIELDTRLRPPERAAAIAALFLPQLQQPARVAEAACPTR